MSDYTQITDFSAKDALSSGDSEKVILGADVDAELGAISTAIATKLNSSGYTAADVLSKLLTVDGASSLLDADFVDGVGPVAIGTYTPTYDTTSNLDSTTGAGNSIYVRLGSIVVVFGRLTTNITNAASSASFHISLPVASNFSAVNQLHGVLSLYSIDSDPELRGSMTADASADDAVVTIASTDDTQNITIGYVFAYQVI